MSKQHNRRVWKRRPDCDPAIEIRSLYRALVVVEALAVTADEAATMLPPVPTASHRRNLARLYTLVHQTSDQVREALEESEGYSPRWLPCPAPRRSRPHAVCTGKHVRLSGRRGRQETTRATRVTEV